jgi:hypothetical protein
MPWRFGLSSLKGNANPILKIYFGVKIIDGVPLDGNAV